jgi:hypothetical protein
VVLSSCMPSSLHVLFLNTWSTMGSESVQLFQMHLNGQVADFTAETFKRQLKYLGSFIGSPLSLPPLMHRDIHFGIAASAFDFATRAISIIESSIIPMSYSTAVEPAIETLATYVSLLCYMKNENLPKYIRQQPNAN